MEHSRIPVRPARLLLLLLPFAALILPAMTNGQDAAAAAPTVFLTDRGTGEVIHALADGTKSKVLAKVKFSNLRGIVADPVDGKLYFADNGSNQIFRADIDGSNLKPIIDGLGFPADLVLDRKNRKLYWCDQQKNHICRANLDGSNVETVVETIQPYYLDIDPEGGDLYWGTFFLKGRIYTRKIEGGDTTTLIAAPTAGLIQVRAVKFNRSSGHLYWVDRQAHKIQRAKLSDGKLEGIEDIYTGLDTPHGMVLDPEGGHVYWADTGTNRVSGSKGAHCIMRGSLDGKEPSVTVYKGSQPWDVDVFRPAKAPVKK